MPPDDTALLAFRYAQPNITPLFGREQIRLHNGQTSAYSLELRWNSRLRLLRDAEKQLHRAQRLRAVGYAIIVVFALLTGFSLYVAPVTAGWLFIAQVTLLLMTMGFLPFILLFSKECRRHRDKLSRKFYESNHEVEYTDDALILINRSTYTAVTQVSLTER
ncbi:hypothetical protein [Salinimonas sediminis]|uniref:Uncharacterized protein n=1 Tax=Salinimonas sediminis TaxID=2303538 RepID=A0A346NQF7_9ALTE|nr:hypothetical protein [Salinimonas sediminis]AXR07764.1 hypothetical protein D0Y50_16195 [Salinimonas sediminis]